MRNFGGFCLSGRSTIALARWEVSRSFSRLQKRVPPLRTRPRISDDDEPQSIKESVQLDPNAAQPITWYPGHIAKAEKALAEYLKKVDVVIEVRDGRIPLSTTHPMVPEWVGSKPLIIAVARIDQISRKALDGWKKYYSVTPPHPTRPDAKVFFIDGKLGAGILPLKKEALKAGVALNERRQKQGIQPRAVRAAIIGFPNVGKSALINRLLGKHKVTSRNLAGVTRALAWVKLGDDEETEEEGIVLLDSPGIIPAGQLDQRAAMKLAICNDIGEASYCRSAAAAAMCDQVIELNNFERGYVDMKRISERYEIPFETLTGEDIVYEVAQKYYRGNMTAASDKLLGDFRKGFMGYCSLEAPGFLEHLKAIKVEDRNLKISEKKEEISQNINMNRDDYFSKHDIGNKVFKDDFGEIIPRKVKKAVSLDLKNGDYEGW